MTHPTFLTIANLLRLLVGAMFALVIAALAVPTWTAVTEARDAARIATVTRIGQDVFAALQYVRPERGTVRAALSAPVPAEAPLLASIAALRDHSAPALEAVLRDCAALRCTADDPRLDGLRSSLERLAGVRRDTDAAIRLKPAERPAALANAWDRTISDTADRLDRLSLALTDQVRLTNGRIGELMAIKQAAWAVRDNAGVERNFYSDGINAGGLSTPLLLKISALRGRIDLGWAMLLDLTARPDAPVRVTTAMTAAKANYFGRFEALRAATHAALLAGQPAPSSLTEWLKISTSGLDSLIAVPNAAVAEAEADARLYAAAAAAALRRQLTLFAFSLLLGSAGIWLVQHRIARPLRAIAATMRRLAAGERTIAIAGDHRRDEIGAMHAALLVFRDSMEQAERLAESREADRQHAATEKQAALVAMADAIEEKTLAVLDQVADGIAALGSTADAMTASAERTGSSANTVTAEAGRTSSNVQAVAGAAEELTASIGEITLRVETAEQTVRRAVAAGGETRGAIQALNETVAQIGTVVGMIGDIAATTNLLALNATIEAARAGEAGRGFAVVAGEVKGLAAQTTRSTNEIGRLIDAVRAATTASVAAVERIETSISEVDGIAASIAATVAQQASATAAIGAAVAETATAVDSVGARAAEVSTEAGLSAQHAGAVHDTAASLNQAVAALKHVITRIVRTSNADTERRQFPRHPLDLPCQVQIPGQSPIAARVRDLSGGGAHLVGMPALPPGSHATLHVPGMRPLAFVVRATDATGDLHLAFDRDATADVAPLLAERLHAAAA